MADSDHASPPPMPAGSAPYRPTLLEILEIFATISLSGFGGVLPWARRRLVEERKLMTAQEFAETFALSQFLPGPNVVNFAVVFGTRLRGFGGGAMALLGLLGPPVMIVMAIAALYALYGQIDALARMLAGMGAAAAGMFIAMAAKMALPLIRQKFGPGQVFAALAFVAVGLLRWPLPYVLAVLIPLSVAVAFWTTAPKAKP